MKHDLEWNAGDLGCGDLVIELRQRCREAPGRLIKVIATDRRRPGRHSRPGAA